MKERLNFLFYVFSVVTTCVVLAVAVFVTVLDPSETVESATLWQIPVVSLFCSLGCLIYPWDKCRGKREAAVRIGLHYIYINIVVLGAGFRFRWYQIDHLKSVAAMLVTIAVIFTVASVIGWRRAAADARRMNERLREYQQQGEGQDADPENPKSPEKLPEKLEKPLEKALEKVQENR